MASAYVTTDPPEVRIPADFDPAIVTATLAEFSDWQGPWPAFADDHSVRVLAEHANSEAILERLRDFSRRDPEREVAFLRFLPPKRWGITSIHSNATAAMALARSIADTRRNTLGDLGVSKPRLGAELGHATDDELAAIVAAITTDVVVEFTLEHAVLVPRFVALIRDGEHLVALWSKLALHSQRRLLHGLDDAQLLHLEAYERARDGAVAHERVVFEALRRGLLDAERFAAILARAGSREAYRRLSHLFDVPHPDAQEDETERLRAIHAAHRHLGPHTDALAAYFVAHRADTRSMDNAAYPGTLLIVAAVYDDAAAAWFADLCNANKDWFRKSYNAGPLGERLADVLAARPDGEQILAALGKRLKGKTLAEVIAQASARLANHRVIFGATTTTEIQWGRTPATDALRLLASFSDPRPVVEAGLASDDPVAVLNAFSTAFRLMAAPELDRAAARAMWSWDFLVTAVRALEARYGPEAPDRKALEKRIGERRAKTTFLDAFEGLYYRLLDWQDPARGAFTAEVLIPLYTSTTNRRFRNWIEDAVLRERPDLAESPRDRMVRLAKALSDTDGETTTRSFVFRGSTPPTKDTINRLFGPPIGVDKKRWPKRGRKAMVHLVTLETRLLAADVAAAYEGLGVAAIAVFVSSLDEHQAFAPGNDHVAIVPLTAADLARGAAVVDDGDRTLAGIALDPLRLELPEAVFEGGTKTGALWELRNALDRGDFLQPDRRSPRWIQAPQPGDGSFLVDLDEDFAPELNLGDRGRFYVFQDAAFLQCY
jgi:hypothetical protein